MNKRPGFAISLSLFLLLYATLSGVGAAAETNMKAFDNFSRVFEQLFLRSSLCIFLVIIGSIKLPPSSSDQSKVSLASIWRIGFLAAILAEVCLVIYVNPHARFSNTRFPPITPSARLIKAVLYEKLLSTPDIVILGSSRAFTLSPDYIANKTEHKTFNMSVEGARVGDLSTELQYILSFPSHPQLLIVEVSPETFGKEFLNTDLQPMALLPFMSPQAAISVAINTLEDTVSLQSTSDSVYIVRLPNVFERLGTWTFEQNGLGIREELTHKQYLGLLEFTIQQRLKTEQCRYLDNGATDELESMINLARENDIAILLYRSPMHVLFHDAVQENNSDRFGICNALINAYLQSLEDAYPNVQFQDLSDGAINHLEEDGFYDAVHLKPAAADLVVDTLMTDILDGQNWSSSGTP